MCAGVADCMLQTAGSIYAFACEDADTFPICLGVVLWPSGTISKPPIQSLADARARQHHMRVSLASFPCRVHVVLLRCSSVRACQVRLHGCSVRTAYCSHALLPCSAHACDHVFVGQGALGCCLRALRYLCVRCSVLRTPCNGCRTTRIVRRGAYGTCTMVAHADARGVASVLVNRCTYAPGWSVRLSLQW